MKFEPEKNRILEDVIHGEAYGDFNTRLKRDAMAAYTKHHRVRRRLLRAGMVAAFLPLIAAVWFLFNQGEPVAPRMAEGDERESQVATVTVAVPDEMFLSDAELLSFFPPNSAFLSEVNGETILVFNDERVREEFFGETGAGQMRPAEMKTQ